MGPYLIVYDVTCGKKICIFCFSLIPQPFHIRSFVRSLRYIWNDIKLFFCFVNQTITHRIYSNSMLPASFEMSNCTILFLGHCSINCLLHYAFVYCFWLAILFKLIWFGCSFVSVLVHLSLVLYITLSNYSQKLRRILVSKQKSYNPSKNITFS